MRLVIVMSLLIGPCCCLGLADEQSLIRKGRPGQDLKHWLAPNTKGWQMAGPKKTFLQMHGERQTLKLVPKRIPGKNVFALTVDIVVCTAGTPRHDASGLRFYDG